MDHWVTQDFSQVLCTEKMTNVMSVHFGSFEEEGQDLNIPDNDDLGLAFGMQDGSSDAPQACPSGVTTTTTSALWAEISQELKLDDELAAPLV